MNIIIAGDFTPRHRVEKYVTEKQFDVVFGDVKKIIDNSSYSIVNLESPVVTSNATPIKKTGPCFKTSYKSLEALKYIGFECVTLANNHLYDYGDIGVNDTLSACKKYNIDYVGGGKNIQEAEQILYKQIENKRIGIINICEHEWSIATDKNGGAAPLDIIKTYYRIKEARQRTDFVLVIVHGGTEHYNLPTPRMKKVYRFFIDAGADIVVNHHQHCYSGYERYNNKYIFYGLGNFCFDTGKARSYLWNHGFLLNLIFNDNIHFELIPYNQCDKTPSIDININKDFFFKDIEELNSVITDDVLLKKSFDINIEKKASSYLTYLEPYSRNKYLFSLRYRHYIPSLLSTPWLRSVLALFRCESHRDVMLGALHKRLSKI